MHPGSSPPALPALAESIRVLHRLLKKPAVPRPQALCDACERPSGARCPAPTRTLNSIIGSLGARGRSWLERPHAPFKPNMMKQSLPYCNAFPKLGYGRSKPLPPEAPRCRTPSGICGTCRTSIRRYGYRAGQPYPRAQRSAAVDALTESWLPWDCQPSG
jgi:hypothetical protein